VSPYEDRQSVAEKENWIEDYKNRIRTEESKLKNINTSIKLFQQQIINQKASVGGVNAGLDAQKSVVKQVKILENRLDKTKQKFNDIVTVNASLINEINSLMKERDIFER